MILQDWSGSWSPFAAAVSLTRVFCAGCGWTWLSSGPQHFEWSAGWTQGPLLRREWLERRIWASPASLNHLQRRGGGGGGVGGCDAFKCCREFSVKHSSWLQSWLWAHKTKLSTSLFSTPAMYDNKIHLTSKRHNLKCGFLAITQPRAREWVYTRG